MKNINKLKKKLIYNDYILIKNKIFLSLPL